MRRRSVGSSVAFSRTSSRRCEMRSRQWGMGSLHWQRLGDDQRWRGRGGGRGYLHCPAGEGSFGRDDPPSTILVSRLEGGRRVATSRAHDCSGKLGVRDRSAGEHFVSVRSVRPLASSPRVPEGMWDLPTGVSSCPCHRGGGAYPGGIDVDAGVGDSDLAWRMPAAWTATRVHLPPFCRVCRSTRPCV
jgi:hypothetical protein